MKVRIKFKKSGAMKFIGHLDVMRYFQKAIRRANIDVQYSKGFNPHQLMSFAAPLGVGLTSDAEYLDLVVGDTLPSEEFARTLNEQMVEGFQIVTVKEVNDETKNAMSIVAAADYMISLKDGYTIKDDVAFDFAKEFSKFYAQEEIRILKKSKKSERIVNIKPWIYQVSFDKSELEKDSVADYYENGTYVIIKVSNGSVNNLKPELVMEAFCEYLQVEFNPFAYQMHRMEVYENLKSVSKDSEETVDISTLVPLDYETTQIQ